MEAVLGSILEAVVEASLDSAPSFSQPLRSPPVLRDISCPAPQCSNCNLRALCLPGKTEDTAIGQVDRLVSTRRRIKRGETLYRAGEPFKSIYAVRSGFFKTFVVTDDGREQITAFQMSGEMMGMDGVGSEHYQLHATALEDSEVCLVPFARLEELSCEIRSLQHQLHRLMSQEIVRGQIVLLLSGMRAEQRVAAFLLNLSQRFAARGFAPNAFNLRMTREEIGSYLGLTLETVSRIFSRFHDSGHVEVQQKQVRLLDPNGLRNLLQQGQAA